MRIDLNTIIITYGFINYICALIIGVTWYRIKDKYEGVLLIFIDLIFQSIGITLAILQPIIPSFVSIILANSLMYIGSIFMLIGIGQFIHLKINKKPYIIMSILFILSYSYFTYIMPITIVRLILFTGFIIPVIMHTIYIILRKANDSHRKFSKHVAISHILLLITHGLRATLGFYNLSRSSYENILQLEALLIMSSLVIMIYITFAVIQMIYTKLLFELDESHQYTNELLRETKYMAITDNLTKLHNRRKIEGTLKEKINLAAIEEEIFSVLMIDIDHFKRFNDDYTEEKTIPKN